MDGVILINKEKNCTSANVVSKVKDILNKKVGHTGTLDPNATGLLPILIGKGTKLSYYLINHDKEYEVTLKLGEKTETADTEGKVIEEKTVSEEMLNKNNVEKVLISFLGEQEQIPPMYSAIKVQGKKLYEYARKDIHIDLKPRKIKIYDIVLNKIDVENKLILFKVQCSKGTYIRSLCEDIANRLGTVGYMKELNRTKVGIFDIKDSIHINELEQNKDNMEYIKKHIISIEQLFIELYGKENKIQLNDNKMQLFINGVKLSFTLENGLYRIYNNENKFVGIGSCNEGKLKREIVI